MTPYIPKILSIAGSDSGGGAGIQADLKTFSALGAHGMTAITAVTSQNTQGVSFVEELTQQSIGSQIQMVFDDLGVDAVKVGMLSNSNTVRSVSLSISQLGLTNVVIDPVLVATSGDLLGKEGTAEALIKYIFPLATIITPNLIEASKLLNRPIAQKEQMAQAAKDLILLGPKAVLLKGGHLTDSDLLDLLAIDKDGKVEYHEFQHAKINTQNTHGTGCTLSAAIAVFLGFGCSIDEAVGKAIAFVEQAMLHSVHLNLGKGHGPLWHAFKDYPQI